MITLMITGLVAGRFDVAPAPPATPALLAGELPAGDDAIPPTG